MARQVVVFSERSEVYLCTIPAHLAVSAQLAAISHIVSPPSQVSSRRVLARTAAALSVELGSPGEALPDRDVRTDIRVWPGRMLSAVSEVAAVSVRSALRNALADISADRLRRFVTDHGEHW